jgi:hypothetical protein
MGGWLNLFVFPGENTWTFIGEVKKHPNREIPFDDQGKLAVLSEGIVGFKNHCFLNSLEFELMCSREKLKLAGSRFGQAIFTQLDGVIVAAIDANIFCIEGNKLITPSLKTGCPDDYFRSITIDSSANLGMKVIETDGLLPADLKNMDEIFTVSEGAGFGWILGVGLKRYVKKYSVNIRNTAEALLWKDRTDM